MVTAFSHVYKFLLFSFDNILLSIKLSIKSVNLIVVKIL
jgi:hypothetical protein